MLLIIHTVLKYIFKINNKIKNLEFLYYLVMQIIDTIIAIFAYFISTSLLNDTHPISIFI